MANVTKKEVYDILNGDDVSPLIANQPHLDLEENIDRILAFLNGGQLNADMLGGVVPSKYARQDMVSDSTTDRLAGWYRIAFNGPVAAGGTGGDRAHAMFTVVDKQSGKHSSITFIASVHFGSEPQITLLSKSNYGTTGGLVQKVRLVSGSTYEGAALELYLSGGGPVEVHVYDNQQAAGWFLDSFSAGLIPNGFTSTELNFYNKNMMFGIASGGADTFYIDRSGVPYTNGQTYLTDADTGAGSGLDADFLDGYDSTAFMKKTDNLNGLTNVATARNVLQLTNHERIDVVSATNIAEGQTGYRLSMDSFHTNGLGFGQMYIEGSQIDSNSPIYIGTGKAGGQTPKDVYLYNPHNHNGQALMTEGDATGLLSKNANLSDVTNKAAARANLNLTNHELISVSSGGIATAVDFTATSDGRLKTNVQYFPDVLDIFNGLRAVRYEMNNVPSVGVIAQEVEPFIPEVVHTDYHGVKSVNYGKLAVLSINAINDLHLKITDLEMRMEELLGRL